MFYYTFTTFDCNFIPRNAEICKVSSETKNVGKAHKYRLNRHLPTYEKIIKNLYSFFVEKYSKNLLKPLRSFAEGLKRDIDAVENAVAYDYSNGFVEGTNSRLKMIKRTMYGRCGRQLLEAKLRYMGYNNNNG